MINNHPKSVYDFRGTEWEHSSPSYIERIAPLTAAEQKEFADWFMENKLHLVPGPFKAGELPSGIPK